MLRQIIGQAKRHPSLIPLFIFIGAGGTGAALYVMRLALFNPDVSWDRKNNPEPWNKLGPNDQYKKIIPHPINFEKENSSNKKNPGLGPLTPRAYWNLCSTL
ncbi:cytochrome c oxidase subunit NDUFA4 isoform X1 [Ovis canadensis]|uniref:NDUFA4 mitochondrial complex associated n=1 Tax=Ovis aries TaxID=9940 RepID=A0AC11APL6_SHEEP